MPSGADTQQVGARPTSIADVLSFWNSAGPSKWFAKDDGFDKEFKSRFENAHLAAAAGLLDDWRKTPDGVLALLILLDQFPRNSYRGSLRMFATDPMARSIARDAVDSGMDAMIEMQLRVFLYLPFEHSESLDDQERAVKLCSNLESETYRFAILHRDIIARFGRFPHRNALLGRESTGEELAFLATGGFAG